MDYSAVAVHFGMMVVYEEPFVNKVKVSLRLWTGHREFQKRPKVQTRKKK